jgi:hypothetical protein
MKKNESNMKIITENKIHTISQRPIRKREKLTGNLMKETGDPFDRRN